MRSYAIGDIHGHINLLRAAHAHIAEDKRAHGDVDAPIIHLGDLVDRGPDCRAVIAYLADGVAAGENWIVLKGNHDRMFTTFLTDPHAQDPGLRAEFSYIHPRIGGAATLASYGVANAGDRPLAPVHAEAAAAVPQSHRDFLEGLPFHHRRGEVLFVHAGIRPGVDLCDQLENDLLWIREPFLSHRESFGPLVVHGHTALDMPIHYGNRLNIDSGAAYGGLLTAVVLEGREVFTLAEAGRSPLQITPDAPVR